MNTLYIAPIKKEIVVDAPQELAFKVFTGKMDGWWPRTHHIGKAPVTEFVLEPGINGRWYSTHEDGSEVNVGKVLVWEPYDRLVLAWQINGDFKFDQHLITEVELHFIQEGPSKTRIRFEHRNLERIGGGKAIESMDKGWGQILELYKQLVNRAENNNS